MTSQLQTPEAVYAFLATLPSEEEIVAKCMELGLIMRRPPRFDVTHPAITLNPTTMRREALYQLYETQKLWNEAVDRTARSYAFLREALRETAESDASFTGRLVKILEEVYLSPHPVFQPLMLGVFRTDYMRSLADAGADAAAMEQATQWKNVEINTISCSFAGLSPLVDTFHHYLHTYRTALLTGKTAEELAVEKQKESEAATATAAKAGAKSEPEVEKSCSGVEVPRALAMAMAAWKRSVPIDALRAEYTSKRTASAGRAASAHIPLQPVVLVVIQENERNTGDQYKLLFELLETHGITSIRRTFTQLHSIMELVEAPKTKAAAAADGQEAQLPPFAIVEQRYVVSVAYFRNAYVPQDFPTEETWQARLDLERCNAVKCPSIPYHIMTFKKLQQLMTDVPGVLTPISFAGNAEKANALAAHFMEQYSLNADEYGGDRPVAANGGVTDPEQWIREAIANPSEFVLKPQLEGGGNLIAGEEMQHVLRDTPQDDPLYHRIRKEYILMRKIHYPKKTAVLFRDGAMHVMENNVCSELGIYGVVLSDGTSSPDPLWNQCAGYVVRSKPSNVEDGGVMAGVACLDSMLLLD